MKARVFFFSVVSALAGFLFGFDTVVVSGAEQTIQKLWNLSPGMHGVAIAAALYGTVVGSLAAGWPTDRYGRRATLLGIGILYVVSALWSALATDVYSFIAARFIGGVGIGVSTVAAPLYIAEIAPAAYRGRLTGMFQFNIVFGIVMAFASNAALAGLGEHAWRWMLGVQVIPALAFALLCLRIPESPRWMLGWRNDKARGIALMKEIEPEASAEEIEQRAEVIRAESSRRLVTPRFWTRELRLPILLAFLVAFFNQLSGINAILYFAPRIFELTGMGAQSAMLQSIGIGVTNLVFTFLGVWLIDRIGRRTLLSIGSFGYIASLGLTAWAFFSETYAIVPACIFAFIAAHAVGQGAVIWVFISEIFPQRHRAHGQTLGSSTHWVFAAVLTTFFPLMVGAVHPGYVFLFFCGMMVLQLIWVKTLVPETKGVPLEDMQRRLSGA